MKGYCPSIQSLSLCCINSVRRLSFIAMDNASTLSINDLDLQTLAEHSIIFSKMTNGETRYASWNS